MSGFQKSVNLTQAPAIAGDFASANPRASTLAPVGGFVAGDDGITVGNFAWVDTDSITLLNSGDIDVAPIGFVHREQQALIQNYLSERSNNVPKGFPVTLSNEGDFYATLTGNVAGTNGANVYANYNDGSVNLSNTSSCTAYIGATATATSGATCTVTTNTSSDTVTITVLTGYISIGDTFSNTVTHAIITDQLTGTPGGAGVYTLDDSISLVGSATCFGDYVTLSNIGGSLYVSIGDTFDGSDPNTYPVDSIISEQLTGTPGKAGRYRLSKRCLKYKAATSGASVYGSVLNVTSIPPAPIKIGAGISGTHIPVDTVINSQISGTPNGSGLYSMSASATEQTTAISLHYVTGVLTNFVCRSVAAVGELIKISSWGK